MSPACRPSVLGAADIRARADADRIHGIGRRWRDTGLYGCRELLRSAKLHRDRCGRDVDCRQRDTDTAATAATASGVSSSKGKTSVRGGIGLFYENVLANIAAFDLLNRSGTGAFSQTPTACSATASPLPVPVPGGMQLQPMFCGTSAGGPVAIGTVAGQIVAFQKLYQQDSPFSLNTPNPNYIGTLLQQGLATGSCPTMYDPHFQTPRSLQVNIGVERELRPGLVLSADFVRNVQTHFLVGIDENHTGDVHYFNKAAALQAISAPNQSFNCGSGTDPCSIQCAITAGAQIADYAFNGLTSSDDFGAVRIAYRFSSASSTLRTAACLMSSRGFFP